MKPLEKSLKKNAKKTNCEKTLYNESKLVPSIFRIQ